MCKTNAISRLYSNIVEQCNTCLLSMAQCWLTSVRGFWLSLFPAWQSHTVFFHDHKSVPFKAVTVPALCKPSSSSTVHRYCIQQSRASSRESGLKSKQYVNLNMLYSREFGVVAWSRSEDLMLST